jgi:Matrixin
VAAAAAGESGGFKTLRLEGNAVRWQLTAQGQPLVVSYSVVAQDVAFAGARNCRKMTPLDGLLSTSRIAPETARAEIAAAFAMWEAVAGISFREAESPERAEILIGAQVEPEGWAFADVFYDMMSPMPVKPISRSLICLNPTRQWKVGFDGDLQRYDLRYTFAHEIGHAIGLDHPMGAGQIMGYRYEERFRELQGGDISGVIQIYGRRQPDMIVAAAPPLATHARRMSPARLYARRWGSRAFTAPAH